MVQIFNNGVISLDKLERRLSKATHSSTPVEAKISSNTDGPNDLKIKSMGKSRTKSWNAVSSDSVSKKLNKQNVEVLRGVDSRSPALFSLLLKAAQADKKTPELAKFLPSQPNGNGFGVSIKEAHGYVQEARKLADASRVLTEQMPAEKLYSKPTPDSIRLYRILFDRHDGAVLRDDDIAKRCENWTEKQKALFVTCLADGSLVSDYYGIPDELKHAFDAVQGSDHVKLVFGGNGYVDDTF